MREINALYENTRRPTAETGKQRGWRDDVVATPLVADRPVFAVTGQHEEDQNGESTDQAGGGRQQYRGGRAKGLFPSIYQRRRPFDTKPLGDEIGITDRADGLLGLVQGQPFRNCNGVTICCRHEDAEQGNPQAGAEFIARCLE